MPPRKDNGDDPGDENDWKASARIVRPLDDRIGGTFDTKRKMRGLWLEIQERLRCPWGNGKPLRYTDAD